VELASSMRLTVFLGLLANLFVPWGIATTGQPLLALLARENLIAAIHLVLNTPTAINETYLVADPQPLTLAEIVAALRAGAGRSPALLPVPPALIAGALRAIGRGSEWERLGGSLVAEPGKLLEAGWQPPVDTRAGLAALMRGNIRSGGIPDRS